MNEMLSLDEQNKLFNAYRDEMVLPKMYQFKTIANDERYSDIPKHRVRIKARYLDVNMDVNDYLTIEFDWINIDILYTVHEMLNSIGVATMLDTDNNMLTVLTAFSGSYILDIIHLESEKICTLFYFNKYNENEDELLMDKNTIVKKIENICDSVVRTDHDRDAYAGYLKYSSYYDFNKLMVNKGETNRLIQKMEIILNYSNSDNIYQNRKLELISDPNLIRIFYGIYLDNKFDVEINGNKLLIKTIVPFIYTRLLRYYIHHYNDMYYYFVKNNKYDYNDDPEDNFIKTFKEWVEGHLIYFNENNDMENINLKVKYQLTDDEVVEIHEIVYKNTFKNQNELINHFLSNSDITYYTDGNTIHIKEPISESVVYGLKVLNLSNYGYDKYLDNDFIDFLIRLM